MYPVAIVGNDVTARAAILCCRNSDIEEISWIDPGNTRDSLPATTLSANLTRVIHALGRGDALAELSYAPDREQIRLARSAYLLSELPLGRFIQQRYGAPHVNIETQALLKVLDAGTPTQSDAHLSIEQLADQHSVVLATTAAPQQASPTHELRYAAIPEDNTPNHANITWLGDGCVAFQFSTLQATHYLFSAPINQLPAPQHWHPSLHDALNAATRVATFNAFEPPMREHWYAANIAFLGQAVFAGSTHQRETLALGLEDAWVVSRMLENYEEDIVDGLREYEKYRRARARRVAANTTETAIKHLSTSPWSRLTRNINIAVSSRFLPEIAMQRIDWLYGFDCIRGFR